MKKLYIALAVFAAIMLVTCLALDAPGIMYLICLGIIVFVYFVTAPIFKQAEALQSEGKIVKRDPNFVETAQIFTFSKVSMDDIIAALKKEGLPFAGLEWKATDNAFGFIYSDWAAQIVKTNGDEAHDIFTFSFTQWKTMKYSVVSNITQMNQLLTAIEKAFLKFDSNTKVRAERVKVNTKNSFF
jgi:hypothetical protein